MKIDKSGEIGKIFRSIPSQLASSSSRFVISKAAREKVLKMKNYFMN